MKNSPEAVNQPDEPVVPGKQFSPLLPDDERHVRLAAMKLAEFRKTERLTWEQVVEAINTTARKDFGRSVADGISRDANWLKSFASRPQSHKISGDLLNVIYRMIDGRKRWDLRSSNRTAVSDIPDHHYYSMLEFLEVPELTTSNLLRRLPGVYTVWRPIVTHADHFVQGYVAISGDSKTGMLSYQEHNGIKARLPRQAKTLDLQGYAFRKSSFVFLSGTDTSKSSIHLSLLGDCEIADDRYIVMMGQFLDTIGNRTYSGKVIMERIPDADPTDSALLAELQETADCHHRTDLPPSIRHFFENSGRVGDVVIC